MPKWQHQSSASEDVIRTATMETIQDLPLRPKSTPFQANPSLTPVLYLFSESRYKIVNFAARASPRYLSTLQKS